MDPLDPQDLQDLQGPQGDILMVNNLRHPHTMEAFQCILEGGQVDPHFS